jgi:hypothetical protein
MPADLDQKRSKILRRLYDSQLLSTLNQDLGGGYRITILMFL